MDIAAGFQLDLADGVSFSGVSDFEVAESVGATYAHMRLGSPDLGCNILLLVNPIIVAFWCPAYNLAFFPALNQYFRCPRVRRTDVEIRSLRSRLVHCFYFRVMPPGFRADRRPKRIARAKAEFAIQTDQHQRRGRHRQRRLRPGAAEG